MELELWGGGDAYEAFVGRWSRDVAARFVRWLDLPPGLRWLDVGCGTGALTTAILDAAAPAHVLGIDPSHGFLTTAREPRAAFIQGSAQDLPLPDNTMDAVVSGLALNFVPDPAAAVTEAARVANTVAAYVWDYQVGMLAHFWSAATETDPTAPVEATRLHSEALAQLWTDSGLDDVHTTAIEIETVFRDFDDYWRPFLGGQGPAPAYLKNLPDDHRDAIRDLLRTRLPRTADGTIALTARAWAVRGMAGQSMPVHRPRS